MHTNLRSRAELWSFNEALKAAAAQYFKVAPGELDEAVAAGFGKRSQSSLIASLKVGNASGPFNVVAFVARLTELTDADTAEALGAIFEGVQLDIRLTKYSDQQMRSHAYSDIAYSASVTVSSQNLEDDALERSAKFLLPEFSAGSGEPEPFRVDSSYTHRLSDEFPVSRAADQRSLIVACLRNLRWEGGLFVYSHHHQANDASCHRSVRGALAKRILAAVSPRLRCLVFKPDHYSEEARRIEISIGQKYRNLLSGVELQFEIPQMPFRMTRIDKGYMGDDIHTGRLVDGRWYGDIYSNGIAEANNPTSLASFRAALVAELHASILRCESHS